MRACAELRSISSAAVFDGAEGGFFHASGGPAKVKHRAVVVEVGGTVKQARAFDRVMAATIWSTTSGRRASEKLGMHSMSWDMERSWLV